MESAGGVGTQLGASSSRRRYLSTEAIIEKEARDEEGPEGGGKEGRRISIIDCDYPRPTTDSAPHLVCLGIVKNVNMGSCPRVSIGREAPRNPD